ncbi:hypothetical protein COUCH_14785 [Couchioplanes caeruleus]|uniref:hypothetical protein n=1 Tax=Couchioplanes caeruleus TaxID=56438 RepID=UPI0020BE8E0F|nr:hypothetical protein [Couchioplanes caeruleus]UQU67452.1 hypothetical protein COUCH_14785 [Couchioplanes caeruleus]
MRRPWRATTAGGGTDKGVAAGGGLWLLGALTVVACTDRFTVLHTDERTAAAIAAAAAAVSVGLTVAYGSPPPLRRLSRAAGMYIVAVLATTWLVVDMATTGW